MLRKVKAPIKSLVKLIVIPNEYGSGLLTMGYQPAQGEVIRGSSFNEAISLVKAESTRKRHEIRCEQ